MQLHTHHLLIRRYEITDAAALCMAKQASHQHLKQWLKWAIEPSTLDAERATISHFHQKDGEGKHWTRAIFLHDGTFIGGIGWWILEDDVRSFEIGYWLDVRHINKGYMTEATRAVTEELFRDKNTHRVVIGCNAANTASADVARRLQFEQEALMKNERRHIDGTLADSLLFAHTPESWKKAKTKLANATPPS